jgi:hypothetical protein
MNNSIKIAASCLSAFTLSVALSGPVWADTVAPTTLVENDKVLVTETILKPGDTAPTANRLGQAFYYVHGGTVELTAADGKKQTFQRKTGAARIVTEKGAFSATNVGKTTIHVIAFSLK